MGLVSAALLGMVQGLTEFLPVSSSAHLILVPWLFGWKPEGIAFDVSLHVGTALAIVTYFWQDWMHLVREAVRGIVARAPLATQESRMAWYYFVGTLPAVFAGLGLERVIEQRLRSPLVIVVTLVAFGLLLYGAEKRSRKTRQLDSVGWSDALWIGLAQAVALIPGVSRSGVTMTCALVRNFERAAAARFSFMLSTPVVVGAGLLEGYRLLHAVAGNSGAAESPSPVNWPVFAVGVAFATASGLLCIRYFLRYLRSHSFTPLVIYRIFLAAMVLMYYFRYYQ